jgi:hypothetical protein
MRDSTPELQRLSIKFATPHTWYRSAETFGDRGSIEYSSSKPQLSVSVESDTHNSWLTHWKVAVISGTFSVSGGGLSQFHKINEQI